MGWVKPWFNIWTDLRKLAKDVRGSRVSYCGTTKAGPVCDLRGHLESISGPKRRLLPCEKHSPKQVPHTQSRHDAVGG